MVVSSSGLICSIREQPLYLPMERFFFTIPEQENNKRLQRLNYSYVCEFFRRICYQQIQCKSIYWSSDSPYNLITGEQRQSQRFQVALPSDFFYLQSNFSYLQEIFPTHCCACFTHSSLTFLKSVPTSVLQCINQWQ